MTGALHGRHVAILATDGVEQVELVEPREAVERAGATTTLVSLGREPIQAMHSDINPGDVFPVDRAVADVSASAFDALILPGGTVNPDRLRMDSDAVGFVREFFAAGKPVGVICHGPITLIEAGVVVGRTLTSYPSIRTDLRNAGATVLDEEVVTDAGLVSSRNPNDLPAFCAKIIEEFAEGSHLARSAGVSG